MTRRIIFSLFLSIACVSLMAQADINNIIYHGKDSAVLYRDNTVLDAVYYWQGTSCGELKGKSDFSYTVTTDGVYYIRGFNSSSSIWNSSCASTTVTFDYTRPVLSNVTVGSVEIGTNILATSNENGKIYLVPEGTAVVKSAIIAASVTDVACTANVAATLSTTGISANKYIVYAIDGSDNISTASSAITVNTSSTGTGSIEDAKALQLYPSPVKDVLTIKTKLTISSVEVYSLRGNKVLSINKSVDKIDMSSLAGGVYVISINFTDKTNFTSKIVKE